RANLFHLADVAGHGSGLAAFGANRLGHRLAALRLAAGDDHMGALLGEQARNGFADAAAGAGNEGDLAVQVEQVGLVHGVFLLLLICHHRVEERMTCRATCSSRPFIFTKGAKRWSRVWPW